MHSPVARGAGGAVGGSKKKKRRRKASEGGERRLESTHVTGGANQSAATCEGPRCKQANVSAPGHVRGGGVHVARGGNRGRPRGGLVRRLEHFSPVVPRSVRIYRLWAEWLVQVQPQTSALLRWRNILLGNKHQPGCQHKQRLLYRAVSFGGDKLQRLLPCRRVVLVLYEDNPSLFFFVASLMKRMTTTDSDAE